MEKYDDILVQKPVRTKGEAGSGSHYNDKNPKYGRSRVRGGVGDVDFQIR
jgi:hypothetical protein